MWSNSISRRYPSEMCMHLKICTKCINNRTEKFIIIKRQLSHNARIQRVFSKYEWFRQICNFIKQPPFLNKIWSLFDSLWFAKSNGKINRKSNARRSKKVLVKNKQCQTELSLTTNFSFLLLKQNKVIFTQSSFKSAIYCITASSHANLSNEVEK